MNNPTVIKVTTHARRSLLAHGIYRLQYLPDTYVKATEGSVGCMCFESLTLARDFINYTYSYAQRKQFLYLRVRGIGGFLYRPRVSGDTTAMGLKEFYVYFRTSARDLIINCIIAPPGTICFPEIYVLD